MADSFEADVRLQGQIKGALAYPVVVLGIAVLLVGVMLLTIVPMFDSMYASMGAELPWVTQIMVDMGKTAPVGIPVIIVCAVAFVMFLEAQSQQRHHSYLVGSVHVEGTRVRQTDHQCGIGAILQQFRIHARFGRAHSAGS